MKTLRCLLQTLAGIPVIRRLVMMHLALTCPHAALVAVYPRRPGVSDLKVRAVGFDRAYFYEVSKLQFGRMQSAQEVRDEIEALADECARPAALPGVT